MQIEKFLTIQMIMTVRSDGYAAMQKIERWSMECNRPYGVLLFWKCSE